MTFHRMRMRYALHAQSDLPRVRPSRYFVITARPRGYRSPISEPIFHDPAARGPLPSVSVWPLGIC